MRRVFQRSDELGKRGRKILRQDRKLPRAVLQPLGGGAEAGASAKGFHRLGQQIDGALSSLFSVKGKGGLIQAVGDLFTVLQLRPQREKLLLLAGTDGGLLQLVDLQGQKRAAALFFRRAHGKGPDAAIQMQKGLVLFVIGVQLLLRDAEGVEIIDVLLLVQQMHPVVLTVNAEKLPAQRAQHGKRGGLSVDAAEIAPVGKNLAAEQKRIVAGKAQLLHSLFHRAAQPVEERRDAGAALSRADQIAADPAAKDGAERVDDDGFTRAGLAGQHRKTALEGELGGLDDGDVFDQKLAKHVTQACRTPARRSARPLRWCEG